MSLRTALDNLAMLNVAGIAHHYSIENLPDQVQRAQLPALLIQVIDTQERLFQERGKGFSTVAFHQGARSVTYAVLHLLLIAPLESGTGMRSHLPSLIDGMDAYFSALGDDVRLGGALLEPAQVKVEPGIFHLGGVDYVGCAFRHTWLIDV
jgi:hypothetical protein